MGCPVCGKFHLFKNCKPPVEKSESKPVVYHIPERSSNSARVDRYEEGPVSSGMDTLTSLFMLGSMVNDNQSSSHSHHDSGSSYDGGGYSGGGDSGGGGGCDCGGGGD